MRKSGRKSKSSLKFIILFFTSALVINAAVMYLVFGVNIFRPAGQSSSTEDSSEGYGYIPYWKSAEEDTGSAASGSNGAFSLLGEQSEGADSSNTGAGYGADAGNAGNAGNAGSGYRNASDSGMSAGLGTDAGTGSSVESGTGIDTDEGDKRFYLTPGQVEALKSMDIADKFAVVAIISKVDGKETDRIIEMAQDGVTYSELGKIRNTLGKYLTAAEIEDLMGIIEKNRNK